MVGWWDSGIVGQAHVTAGWALANDTKHQTPLTDEDPRQAQLTSD